MHGVIFGVKEASRIRRDVVCNYHRKERFRGWHGTIRRKKTHAKILGY